MKLAILLSLVCFSAFANDIKLKEYNWYLTDVASRGLSKETLFTRMDRKFIKPGKSICSNRALMWANDFKNQYNLDTAKIFLFYTEKKEEDVHPGAKTWWYHVAPVVNEHGSLWVMDAGFSGFVKTPLTTGQWLQKFTKSTNCKEIQAHETELAELIYTEQAFPHQTSYGYYDCYYRIVPHTLWTPEIMVRNLLGRDSAGRPVRVERNGIDQRELYASCLEATTTTIQRALGKNKKECRAYAGIPEDQKDNFEKFLDDLFGSNDEGSETEI